MSFFFSFVFFPPQLFRSKERKKKKDSSHLVGQRLRRRDRDRVARVHAHRVEVLDRADDDDVVGEVLRRILRFFCFESQVFFFTLVVSVFSPFSLRRKQKRKKRLRKLQLTLMTSSSYSFQPSSDCSISTWSVSEAAIPAETIS